MSVPQVATAVPVERLDLADMRRRLKAIFIGSIGNLGEWYDFYAYAAFALYFAGAFFPNQGPVVQQLDAAVLFAARCRFTTSRRRMNCGACWIAPGIAWLAGGSAKPCIPD